MPPTAVPVQGSDLQNGLAAILNPQGAVARFQRPNPTLRERFTHYYNLRRTAVKLTALLGGFRLGLLADLLDDAVLSEGGILFYGSP